MRAAGAPPSPADSPALREAADIVRSPFSRGPYLVAAVICDEGSRRNGASPRILVVDQLVQLVPGPRASAPTIGPVARNLAMFVSFRRGEATGRRYLEIVSVRPSGPRMAFFETELDFAGDDPAASRDVWASIAFMADGPGVHWFEVRLDGVLVTRTPLRVVYRTAGSPEANESGAVLE